MGLKKARSVLTISTVAILVVMGTAPAAHAYIDPGSGSFIFQMLIAGLLSASVFARTIWRRLRSIFSSSTDKAR